MSRLARYAPAVGLCFSLAAHAALLLLSVASPQAPAIPSVRVRVEIRPPLPTPSPPPAPEVPPPPTKPRQLLPGAPKPLDTPDLAPNPFPVVKPVLVPGLTSTSFSSTGAFAVPSGSGVSIPAPAPGPAAGPGAGGGVNEPARVRSKPAMEVPEAARTARIEGSWTVLVDVDAEGHPTRVRVSAPIGWGIDDACVEAWMRSRWRAAQSGGVPVASTANPVRCTVREKR
jgi:outer membrane biosynthesis protein TonB